MMLTEPNFSYSISARRRNFHPDITSITGVVGAIALLSAVSATNAYISPVTTGQSATWTQTHPAVGKKEISVLVGAEGATLSTVPASDIQNESSAMSASDQLKLLSIYEKIIGYHNLPENFDGYGGHAPNIKDIWNAWLFIKHIPAAGIDTVRTMAAGDGDVGFDWDHEGHHLEVGFYEGAISFFGVMPDGEKINGDVDFDENNIPEKLQRLMYTILRK